MYKKFLTLGAALALTLSMAACAASSDAETTKPGDSKPSATTPSTTPSTKPSTQEPTQPSTQPEEGFREMVLAEDDKVTVKVTAVENDKIFGYALKVFLENKTDMELMFTVEDVAVNGFMCDPLWARTVAPGKKSNESISFSEKSFKDNGIEKVEEISLTLRIYNNADWLAPDVVNETITLKF